MKKQKIGIFEINKQPKPKNQVIQYLKGDIEGIVIYEDHICLRMADGSLIGYIREVKNDG